MIFSKEELEYLFNTLGLVQHHYGEDDLLNELYIKIEHELETRE